MKLLLLPILAALALPNAVHSGMRFERIPTGYCSTNQKKAPKGSDCFEFTEINDGDPSVYVLGKKYPNLESKKSLKPIPWGGSGASHGNYLTRYTMEIRLHYLINEVRHDKGLKKLKWDERTYKLTNKGRHEYSKW